MTPPPQPQQPPSPSSPAPPRVPPARGAPERLAVLKQWLRHHASAAAATGLDFLTMVTAVEFAGADAVAATALGAGVGAVANFLLGRHWAYRRPDGAIAGQAIRYALVSAAGLGLNALGVYVLVHHLGLQYVIGRIITAAIVANAWNYPLQRFFVFSSRFTGRRRAEA